MANKKIKGITIQLGVDAGPLDKALKGIDSTTRSLNGELGQVNKLLKFDPGNTQMLAQKQKVLAESVENSSKKLDALKQAQGEVERMFRNGDIGEREYREFQRAITETEQSIKSYTAQMDRMQAEQEKLQRGTKQLNTFLEATGRSLDDFQDVLGSRLTNALKNGTASSDDLTVAINKIGKSALGADTDLGQMRNALDQIDAAGIDEVRAALRELEGDSGNAEDGLNDIGEGIAAGNLMEAGEAVAGLGDKVMELGGRALESFQSLEDAVIKVNSHFNESGEEAKKNSDLIKKVYEEGLGDSLDSVANAVILVKDNLKGLNDSDLENIISQGLILEDTYGVDMPESLRGINALMQHFGLNSTEAMDMFVAGTQGGLDKTNELGDNLAEYSGKFSEAGYSAQEYFQLLQNGLSSGAYNLDKVNDAINEVTTRLADGTIADAIGSYSQETQDLFAAWQNGEATQKQVVDSIVTDIAGCTNQQEKLNLAAKAFGTMAEDGSMKFITALSSAGDGYDNVKGRAEEFQNTTTTSSQKMEASLRKISDAMIPIGEDIQKMLEPVLEFIADLAEKFGKLPEPVRNFIEVLGGIAAAVAIITPVIATILVVKSALGLLCISLLPIIGIVAGVVAVIAAVIVVIKNWGKITDWLSEKWSLFKEWISGIWESIAESASAIWEGIKEYFAGLWESIANKLSEAWNKITETVKNVWNGILEFLRDIWRGIYSVIEIPLKLILSIIDGVMYVIYATLYVIWEVIKAALKAAWDWIQKTASAIFTPIAEFFETLWNGISNVATAVWEVIKAALKAVWDWIRSTASAIFTPLANFLSNTWTNIKDTVLNVWNSIKNTLGSIWDGIKNKATEVFSSVWNFIKDGFNSLGGSLGGIVKNIANGIISPIGNAINGIIKGINWILDKVGSSKQFALWDVPKFAEGTGGLKKDTIGVVNDQKGSIYKELIVPPRGKPFIAKGRDVVLPMEKGTKIVPAGKTKNFLESIPHFAGGIGDFFSGAWETVKSFTGNVLDYISQPTKIVQIAIDKFSDLSGAVEPWISVAKGAVSSVFDGVVSFIKGIFDTEAKVNYNPSEGVEQWRGMADRALRMTGQYSESNLTRLLYQMQTESGGNPNAINNWDINAKRGTPSKGLMQVIDPTFRSYAMPGYNTNIWDPVSNILASIRYAVTRYGSLAKAYRGTGYEGGIGDVNLSDVFPNIPALNVHWFKDGGILTKPAFFNMGGGKVGGAGEAGAEVIAPVKKLKEYVQDAVLEILGTKNIDITINITDVLDGKVLGSVIGKHVAPIIDSIENRERRKRGGR